MGCELVSDDLLCECYEEDGEKGKLLCHEWIGEEVTIGQAFRDFFLLRCDVASLGYFLTFREDVMTQLHAQD